MVIFAMVGFCSVDVNPLGPLHEYVAPVMVLAVSDNVCPEQTVLLLPAVGVPGGGFTVTVIVPAVLTHPFAVAVTE